jgi:3',5'-cyclic AMP phosphodiesterase CpdA
LSVLLQISDLHFGTERTTVVEALISLARAANPDLLVLSGDITQRARSSQFQAARTFCEALGSPVLLALPGNHDIPLFNFIARFFFPYRNFYKRFGPALEFDHDHESFRVIGVNTTRSWRHIDGEVSHSQIRRVSAQLRKASPHQIRMVVTHQPVHVIRPEDQKNLLHGHEIAVQEWTDAGVDLILGGHIHLPHLRPLSDRFPQLSRKVWSVQAGTATSHRLRYEASNSVNIIRDAGNHPLRCTVERWDFNDLVHGFELRQSDTLFLDRRVSEQSRPGHPPDSEP